MYPLILLVPAQSFVYDMDDEPLRRICYAAVLVAERTYGVASMVGK